MEIQKAAVVICRGGILGLTIARELIRQGADNIILLEKEDDLGKHASGRNSGVLHAGIYYPAGSLKARLCLRGNALLKAYCRSKGLPLLETGKVVVTKNGDELEALHRLHDMAIANGAEAQLIDEKRLAQLEPYALTYRQALHSHLT